MLRPATPLSVLLFAAFALLLISVLSTPIISAIPLGTFRGINFGVFGFCRPSGCSGIEIGYDTSGVFSDEDSASFDLPSSTRTTLSYLLILHPVAALLTLIMFVLAVTSHFHSPSHSSRYLLIVFIFSLLNLVICLLVFLVDVLLFVPHMAWGAYLVLAATILAALSSIISCAMRRTIVGRKARKKQIAMNAEMSGENYYNREAQRQPVPVVSSVLHPVPEVSGANGTGNDKLPVFATFESKEDDRNSDERVPLTARTPSDRSPNTLPAAELASPPGPYNNTDAMNGARKQPGGPPQLDQYGNPIMGVGPGYGMRRDQSVDSINSVNSRGGRGGLPPGGYRGRGGFGGRGGYGPPPGPNGRGGRGAPGRGGYGSPPNGRGGYGTPRGNYGPLPGMRGGRAPPPGYHAVGGPYDSRGSPAGTGQGQGPYPGQGPYSRQQSPGPRQYTNNMSMPSVSTDSQGPYSNRNSLPRAESPPPLPGIDDGVTMPGQAVEMDAAGGARNPSSTPRGIGQYGIRESDSDVAGMLALQQGRTSRSERDTYDGRRHSQEQHIPPRQGWSQPGGRSSPAIALSPLSAAGSGRAELPARSGPAPPRPTASQVSGYYEDVDPRFADAPPAVSTTTPVPVPPSYATDSYEDVRSIPEGARSPAESERSNFTSISQRGINPRWHPPPGAPGGYGNSAVPPRRPVPRNDVNEVLLNSNPDFQLSRNSPSRGPGGPAMIPDSSYPTRGL